MDKRSLYIKAQTASIAEVYGERYGVPVQVDPNLEYLLIPRFTLPPRWGERETPLLIHLPAMYPDKPPHGFYLSARCQGLHIYKQPPYRDLQDLSPLGWNWYCVSCDAGWKAGASPLDENNLWTFLTVIRTSLSISEF